jgi:hypothetical protein
MIHLLLLILSLAHPISTATQNAQAEDDIREAVFRYMFEHRATQQQPYTNAFFIAIEKDKDPSDEFMNRFKRQKPVVKKLSQATYSKDTGMIVDKEAGGGGIRYTVGAVKWINEKEARLEGGYYVAMLFAGGCEYRIVLEGEKWVVTGCEGSHWES